MPERRLFVMAVLLCAAVAGRLPGLALADNHGARCTLTTLDGLYIFAATGSIIPASGPQPKAIVELIRFNGDGTLRVRGGTRNVNGTIIREPPGVAGSYTVENLVPADGVCAATSRLPAARHLTWSSGPRERRSG
jgi:hypothetical protein